MSGSSRSDPLAIESLGASSPVVGKARVYRVSPKKFRAMILLSIFFCLAAVFALWVDLYLMKESLDLERILRTSLLFVMLPMILSPVLFCIKLDENGCHFRRYFKWRCWTWADFSEGRVYRVEDAKTFRRRDSVGKTRNLSLKFLSDGDFEEISKLLDKAMPMRPEIEPPESIEVGPRNWGHSINFHARFEPSGVHWRKGKQNEEFQWSDVSTLKILRVSRSHAGFRHLRLDVKDKSIRLEVAPDQNHRDQYAPKWKGADAEHVVAYLLRHIAREKIVDASMEGDPSNIAEADFRREITLEEIRQFASLMKMILGVIGFSGFFMAVVFAALEGSFSIPTLLWGGGIVLACLALVSLIWWRGWKGQNIQVLELEAFEPK